MLRCQFLGRNVLPIAICNQPIIPQRRVAFLSVTRLRCAKPVQRIKVLFGLETFGYPKHILDGGTYPLR